MVTVQRIALCVPPFCVGCLFWVRTSGRVRRIMYYEEEASRMCSGLAEPDAARRSRTEPEARLLSNLRGPGPGWLQGTGGKTADITRNK
jgi:hypothetical protein